MKYKDIKTFTQRCEEHPDHQTGMITYSMIEQRLHEEIDELREYIEQRKPLTDEQCINQMLNSGFERNSLGWSFTYGRLDYHLLKFARAIEAAHGIKE